MKTLIAFVIAVVAGSISVRADIQADTTISLITCYPGSDIYELEGHTALRINMGPGNDFVVHWGVFDFNAPNFVYRFVKGETDYMCALFPTEPFIESYRRAGRRVEEQRVRLTRQQTVRLMDMLQDNLQPDNRIYRYNYVKDNCATRPLALIRAAVGDSLSLSPCIFDIESRPVSFRDIMRHYHRNYPWYQFGIDLALGSGIDYPLSRDEQAFAPVLLEQLLAGARTTSGEEIADDVRVLVDLPAYNAVASPTPWYLAPDAVCWLVFILLAIGTVQDIRHRRVTRWIDAVYFGILGCAGLVLTFLIFVSVHEATSPNFLYAWLNPLCFIPVIFIWLKKGNKVVFCYQIINFAVVLLTLLSWPMLPQSANTAFLPLVLGDLMRSGSYIVLTRGSVRVKTQRQTGIA